VDLQFRRIGIGQGLAGAFIYNEKANKALKDFYERNDTLSLVCATVVN
jgi:phosphoribosylformylglycinamidine synthase